LLFAAALLAADELPAADDSAADTERREEVSQLAPAKARMLELSVGGEEPVAASLHAKPLLRWSNPTAGSVYGEVFVWQASGQPVAVASIFRWYHPFKDGTVEITSLSTQPVTARDGGKVEWECKSPGVTFAELPEAAAPAAAAGRRLTQMRALARSFAAELQDTRSGEQVTRKLRLLNQPLHRYSSPDHGIIDGALFALAEVTDPEVIVIVEAAREGDSPKWRYALARMNNHELEVRLDDKLVQSWPRIDAPWKDRRSSYTLFSFDPQTVKTDEPSSKP
jgi:hypothetical protein